MATYTVQRGDTLWQLAQRFAGNGALWNAIQQANPTITPTALRVGATITIPDNILTDQGRATLGGGPPASQQPTGGVAEAVITPPGTGVPGTPITSYDPSTRRDRQDPRDRLGNQTIFDPTQVPVPTVPVPQPPTTTPTNPAPTGPTPEEEAEQRRQRTNAWEAAKAAFPWIEQVGLANQVRDWIFEGYEGDALVGLIRQQPAWQEMFPNIRRQDGTLRMTEGQYLGVMDNYRSIVKQYFPDADYTNGELSNFLASDLDSGELEQRMSLYSQLVRGGQDVRNAFYVYAGISMSDEDLYNYVVDPNVRRDFDDRYMASNSPDYATFLGRTVDVVTLQTGATVPREVAGAVLDQLYHGGNPLGGDFLTLDELTNSFEMAMIGSAATSQGLVLPTEERLQEIRLAGINRAQALRAYGQYQRDRSFLNAITGRVGGGEFTQDEFEAATFLSDADASNELRRAEQQEKARSRTGGSPSFGREAGRITQTGFTAFRS